MIQPFKILGGNMITDGVIDYNIDRSPIVVSYRNFYNQKPNVYGWSNCEYISDKAIAIIFEKGKRPDLPYPQRR